jgi:hypothetical protein
MFDPLDFGASGLMEGLQFGHRLGWATGPSLVERRQQLLDRAGRRPLDFRDDRNSVGYSRFHSPVEELSMDENRVEGTARNLGGKVQEGVGRVTGNAQTRVEGLAKQGSRYRSRSLWSSDRYRA